MNGTRQSGNSTVWSLLLFATLALFAAALYTIFVVAPVEQQMGIVQKIFYFHVPSAYAMYIGFFVSAVGSENHARQKRRREPRVPGPPDAPGLTRPERTCEQHDQAKQRPDLRARDSDRIPSRVALE